VRQQREAEDETRDNCWLSGGKHHVGQADWYAGNVDGGQAGLLASNNPTVRKQLRDQRDKDSTGHWKAKSVDEYTARMLPHTQTHGII
jgi:hypothetical protein